jgi:hypothetical protein
MYAVAQMSSFAAVLYLLFMFFFALCGAKKNTDKIASTMLPQAERRLRAATHKSCHGVVGTYEGTGDKQCCKLYHHYEICIHLSYVMRKSDD